MTPEEFAKSMLVLQAGIGREFSQPTLEVWYRILGDLDAVDFGYAIDRYLAESTSGFPMPAQLRIFVDELRHGEPLDHSREWAAVLQASHDNYTRDDWAKTRESLDPITLAAVERIGGWRMLGMIRIDQLPTVLAQFRTAFQAEQKRVLRDRRLPEALRPAIAHHRRIESDRNSPSPEITARAASMFKLPSEAQHDR